VLLSASEIQDEIARGRVNIEPFTPALLRRASYTLRLGGHWLRWKKSEIPIKLWSHNAAEAHLEATNHDSSTILYPGDLILAPTLESISLPNDIAGVVCTLSHVARFGLTATSGSLLVRPGYGSEQSHALTLELASSNPSPLELCAGMPICHLAFLRLTNTATQTSQSVYEQYAAPCPPMLFEDMLHLIGPLSKSNSSPHILE
jgi:dCTP deaminase